MYAVTRYDAMCSSILACHGVDEVAEIRNKARAMEVYAKQAMNLDAERQAVEIRIRAERKAGELLSYMDRKQGGIKKFHSVHGRPNEIIKCNNCGELYDSTKWDSSISGKCPYCLKSDFQEAKEVSNISDSQAKRWQKLATIPDQEFEESVRGKELPTTNGILRDRMPMQEKPMDKKAVALWGEVKNFNRIVEGDNIKYLLNELTESMKASVYKECEQIINKCEAILSERF